MKHKLFTLFAALICATTTLAQTVVMNDKELRAAVQINNVDIKLGADIDLSNSTLSIERTVTIDLGGHALDRKLTKRGEGGGQVITVRKGATLNLKNGTLKGGWGGNGGGLVNEGGIVTLTDVNITGNTADDRGGGISNHGTLTMTGGRISGNTTNDQTAPEGGGGIMNSEGATATLTNVSITGNTVNVKGGGGICNYGTMTLDGCTITGNSCKMNGGGIWTAASATLNMQGAMTMTDNTTDGGVTNNLFLKTGAVVTITGSLAGSTVGVNMEATTGTFTSGYNTHNAGVDPTTIFTPDDDLFYDVTMSEDEACVSPTDLIYPVTKDSELRAAIKIADANIKLSANIDLSNSTLAISDNRTVTIDLNNYTLDRKLRYRGEGGGQVFTVRGGATLNLSNGTLKGGWGGDSGGINNEGGTVNLTNVNITGCTGDDRGGGICNRDGGTLNMTGGAIIGNTSNDRTDPAGGGGLFNAHGATARLKGVTITGNVAKVHGGGGLCNFGTLTLDGDTITENTAGTHGGGVWEEGTLKIKGALVVKDNHRTNGGDDNLYCRNDHVAMVTGELAGSDIHITLQSETGIFTSAYNNHHNDVDPATIFASDHPAVHTVFLNAYKEAELKYRGDVEYIKCSWDSKNRQVVNTTKTLTRLIGYNDVPTEGDYKEVKPVSGWFALGGFSNDDEYYVVRGNVSHTTLNVLGPKVHLILCDGAKLSLSGGILCYNTESNKPTLYIHCQSYDGNMGELYIASGYKAEAAGIGSDWEDDEGGKRIAGNLEIHGGNLSVTGGDLAAGIGGGHLQEAGKITIYGGDIKAYGGKGTTIYSGGAAIGGSAHGGGHTVIYGGKVYAKSIDSAAGIGAGHYVYNDLTVTNYDYGHVSDDDHESDTYAITVVDIYGGEVEAHGAKNAAGIGGGKYSNGVILNIYGGDVKAYGGDDGAGIGGGWDGEGGLTIIKGGTVYAKGGGNGAGIGGGSVQFHSYITPGGTLVVSGGHVEAYGGVDAAGIGGGEGGQGGSVKISGGYVYAQGNDYGSGIGGGQHGWGGDVTITGGTVIAKAGRNETGMRAIGPGEDNDKYGTLTIGDEMMVSSERMASAVERINMCWYRTQVRVEPCDHHDHTYKVEDTTAKGTHTMQCQWCTTPFEPEQHTFVDKVCTVCGANQTFGTGVEEVRSEEVKSEKWYTLDGRRLSGKPSRAGVYIYNGKMCVIK